MKMAALLVLERQAVKKQIHQVSFAASNAAPDIQTALGSAWRFSAKETADKSCARLWFEQSSA
jgi:hypothetical protein